MATASHTTRLDRFADVVDEPRNLLQPIEGYQSLPLVTLEEAVECIVDVCPDVRRRAYIAKGNCDTCKDGLNEDESAAIFLYTTEWSPNNQCLYVALNSVLRSKNRNKLLKPWLSYMKLFLTALFKLPSCTETVWRGVPHDLRNDYEVGKTITWWGFSSCTGSVAVLQSELFLGQEGKRTMFSIKCFNARKIRGHSSFEDEDEILILPGSQFLVESHLQPSKKDPDLIIIQLKQIQPPFELLEEPWKGAASSTATAKSESSKKQTEVDSSYFKSKDQPETIVIPVPSKVDNKKDSTSYTNKVAPTTIKKETTKYSVKSEDQQFATPGTYKMLDCKGRHCASCGKCRDWYFTGDRQTWTWIRNVKNWTKEDRQRYYNDRVYERFSRRDGSRCHHHHHLHLLHHYLHLLCLCEDNIGE